MVFEWLRDLFSSLINSIKEWVKERLASIRKAIDYVKQSINEVKNEILKRVKKLIDLAKTVIKVWVKAQLATLKKIFENLIGKTKDYAKNLADNIKKKIDSAISGLKKWVLERLSSIKDFFLRLVGTINEKIRNLAEFISQLPAKVWEWVLPNLTKWIKQMVDELFNYIMHAIMDIKYFFYINTLEFMRTTMVEQLVQIYRQYGVGEVDRAKVREEIEKIKPQVKRLLGV